MTSDIMTLTNEERRELAIEILLQCCDYRVSKNVTVRGALQLSAEALELAREEIAGMIETLDRTFACEPGYSTCWNNYWIDGRHMDSHWTERLKDRTNNNGEQS